MPRVQLRGNTTHYQQLGQGSDIVLIHGLFCSIAFWWFWVAPKLAETHRVTAMDLRGHGFSGLTPDRYRARDMAEDVLALLDHLEIQRAHIVGHSFGGAVAAALAAAHPDRVHRLSLADAWLPSLQDAPLLTAQGEWSGLQKRLADQGVSAEPDMPLVVRGFFEEVLDSPEGAVSGTGMMGFPGQGGGRAMKRWKQLMALPTAKAEIHDPAGLDPDALQRIEVPVRLVYGSRSRFLPTRDRLAEILPEHESLLLPGAGHFFPLLRPAAFVASLDAVA
ncbi:alpha/beta fold hydrolase [Rhodovulum adriaticum]|uniref:Pimeloyl-ACP methyl ester carboxylesterase n=1 Tax=Rhodovulum adriaticum TaxID=35804 RepID=A0A4R2NUW1_RHOAD|nr:alpha/beta hydrolase [Rhodovulum adriaticum]MBK1635016.1 hypothetical protein [Rhodovulum adriaticum]TCP25351.1 pimeloyl-ACP methyl ester carboxylesterase [Rhodovulum adriaticum]